MDGGLLRCISFLLLLGIISGSSAELNKRTQKHDSLQDRKLLTSFEDGTMIMHDTYPTIVGSPTDVPTLNPSPTTPDFRTPMTAPPTTPDTGSPMTPTVGPPSTPTTNPPPSFDGGGGMGGGTGGGGMGGGTGGGGMGGGGTGGGGMGGGGTGGGGMGGGGAGVGPGGGGGGGMGGGGGGGGGGSWCVASASASEKALQVGLDYACGFGGADCSQIQPGASCYNPNTIRDHTSYAYNDYYQKNPSPTSCDFGGTAQIVNNDPSSGSCHFSSKGSASSTPLTPTPLTPTPTMPSMQTPPTMMSPPSPSSPLMPAGNPFGGSSGFGQEPIASPNMAATTSQNLLILLSSTSMLMYILLANHV